MASTGLLKVLFASLLSLTGCYWVLLGLIQLDRLEMGIRGLYWIAKGLFSPLLRGISITGF